MMNFAQIGAMMGAQSDNVRYYNILISSLSSITNNACVGDSFTFGLNANPRLTNRYITLLTAAKSLTIGNDLGVSSGGVWRGAKDLNAASFTRSSTLVTMMSGFNDIRPGGYGFRTLNKISAAYSSALAKMFCNVNSRPSGAATVTRTGSFSGFDAATNGGQFPSGTPGSGNFASQTSGAGTWEVALTGVDFGFQFIANGASGTYGTAKMYIDNVLVGTVNLNDWTDDLTDGLGNVNSKTPLFFPFFGYASGSHTLKVEAMGDGIVALDFFGNMSTTSQGAFLAFEVPFMSSIGYAIGAGQGSAYAAVEASNVIFDQIKIFSDRGYRAGFATTNIPRGQYDLTTGLDLIINGGDDIHPNNTGHTQLSNSGLAVLP